MNNGPVARSLSTPDLAGAAQLPPPATDSDPGPSVVDAAIAGAGQAGEPLAPLFLPAAAADFRQRWDAVQGSFVDDPRQSVRHGDELVAQAMRSLTETFANERARLEAQVDQADTASTEDLRVALRRYRSFFERLLAL